MEFNKKFIGGVLMIWMIFTFINYYLNHSYYFLSIDHMTYGSVWLLEAMILGVSYTFIKKGLLIFRPWMGYVLLLVNIVFLHLIYGQTLDKAHSLTAANTLYFVLNVLIIHLKLLLISFGLIGIGSLFNRICRNVISLNDGKHQLFGIGIIIWTVYLFFVAKLGIFTPIVIGIPLIIGASLAYKDLWEWIKGLNTKHTDTDKFGLAVVIYFGIFISILSVIVMASFKMFPIGYDASRVYQMISKNIFDLGELVPGFHAYNWPLFTASCARLFNDFSISVISSHAMILACCMILYSIAIKFLSLRNTWLLLSLFASMPMVAFLGFIDSKVDLAFLFFILLFSQILIEKLNLYKDSIEEIPLRFYFVFGLLLGYLFGVKYLGFYFIMSSVCLIAFYYFRYLGLIVCLLLSLAFVFGSKLYKFSYLEIENTQVYLLVVLLVLSSIYGIYTAKKNLHFDKISGFLKRVSIMAIGAFIAFGPWMVKNYQESNSLNISSLIIGTEKLDNLNFNYDYFAKANIDFILYDHHKDRIDLLLSPLQRDTLTDVEKYTTLKNVPTIRNRQSRQKLKAEFKEIEKLKDKEDKDSEVEEEIKRYFGFDGDFLNFVSLPFDSVMGINTTNKRGMDFGPWLFLLFPFLIIRRPFFKIKQSEIIASLIVIFVLSVSIYLAYSKNSVDLDQYFLKLLIGDSGLTGFLKKIVFFPFLYLSQLFLNDYFSYLINWFENIPIMFAFIGIIIGFVATSYLSRSVIKENSKFKDLMILGSIYGLYWFILGSGIPFYGLFTWTVILIIFIHLFETNYFNTAIKKYFFISIHLVLFLQFILMFTHNQNNWKNSSSLFYLPFVQNYSQSINPRFDYAIMDSATANIIKTINANPEDKIYKISTFLGFHINDKLNRCFDDDLLQIYNRTSLLLKDESDYFDLLKSKNIKYILLDLNIKSVDKTPDKSLSKRVDAFVKLLNNPNKLRFIGTDNVVEWMNPETNRLEYRYGLSGKVKHAGYVACFEIL